MINETSNVQVVKVVPKWNVAKGIAIGCIAYASYQVGRFVSDVRHRINEYYEERDKEKVKKPDYDYKTWRKES